MQKIKLFDSHLHIIDHQFPLYENQGFTPEPFTTMNYLTRLNEFDLLGGAIVSGLFQKTDQTYLIDALEKLGPNYVGVIQILTDTSDETILELDKAGVRAVRFNLKRGGSEELSQLKNVAHRIFELALWHVELYVDSTELVNLKDTLTSLPSVSIDHLGLSKTGFSTLLELTEKDVKVKATGFGRIDFDPKQAIQDLYQANPNALMFGTDLLSTRAPKPFTDNDIDIIRDALDESAANKVLFKNALNFYLGNHS